MPYDISTTNVFLHVHLMPEPRSMSCLTFYTFALGAKHELLSIHFLTSTVLRNYPTIVPFSVFAEVLVTLDFKYPVGYAHRVS